MALAFSEGSIGGDIEMINLKALQDFYGDSKNAVSAHQEINYDLRGSNGIALGPSITSSKHPLLLINPHTSFYFRTELQMTSDEGLDCYGATTWGQFFIYQGFNEQLGFMHTSSSVDAIDEYLESVTKKNSSYFYKYGTEVRPVTKETIRIPYKTKTGVSEKVFAVFRTHHGPIVRKVDDKWVSVSLMQKPVEAISQSYLRMKAKNLAEFKKTLEMQADSSNNTIYADQDGNIAFFYATFVPRRSSQLDFTKPVMGHLPESDWNGVLPISELPTVLNPKNGWVFNSNNSPWSAAGYETLKKSDYPHYVDTGSENARGEHILSMLKDKRNLDFDAFTALAFDSYLTWFEKPLPLLVKAWDDLPSSNPLRQKLSAQIALLKSWNMRWSLDSPATTLAILWGDELIKNGQEVQKRSEKMLQALLIASEKLAAEFGKWEVLWGEVNRFQRLSGDVIQRFSDREPSTPVPFPSGYWGSLAAFRASNYNGSKRKYGNGGNSFVAVVEFGPKIKAKAILVGGQSSDPSSRHFNDQTDIYAKGKLRDVYFYPSQLKGHVESRYHPGVSTKSNR